MHKYLGVVFVVVAALKNLKTTATRFEEVFPGLSSSFKRGVDSCPGFSAVQRHNASSKWFGWNCRRKSMAFRGEIHDVNEVDFGEMHASGKTALRLHLTNHGSVDTGSDLFEKWPSLRQLYLALNRTRIAADLFKPLKALRRLTLITYRYDLPKGLFAPLLSLTELTLVVKHPHSRLKPFERDAAFHRVVANDHISEILFDDVFAHNKLLKEVTIDCSVCEHIPPKLFANNAQLEMAKLKTSAGFLPPQLFAATPHLDFVKIRSSNCILVHSLLFDGAVHSELQHLEIHSPCIRLAENCLSDLSSLRFLSFHGAFDASMDFTQSVQRHAFETMFANLSNLVYFDMGSMFEAPDTGYSESSEWHDSWESGTERMAARNPATGLCLDRLKLPTADGSLYHLRLENNGIRQLPTGFLKGMRHLATVILDTNQIRSVAKHDTFDGLRNLTSVHFSHNSQLLLYCDFGWSNRLRFPHLAIVDLSDTAHSHSCELPWLKQLQRSRPMLEVKTQPFAVSDSKRRAAANQFAKPCRFPQMLRAPKQATVGQTLTFVFGGPNVFVRHSVYWLQSTVDMCTDFRDVKKLKRDAMFQVTGPRVVSADGSVSVRFEEAGEFQLVYKFGAQSVYLPMTDVKITVSF